MLRIVSGRANESRDLLNGIASDASPGAGFSPRFARDIE